MEFTRKVDGVSEKERYATKMIEQMRKLPEDMQERIGWAIQGAVLIAGNHAGKCGAADDPRARA